MALYLPKRKDNDEKNYLKKYKEEKITLDFYRLFHEIMTSCQFSQYYFAVLIIIDQLQIQYYAWHPFLDSFLYKNSIRIDFRNYIQYLQVHFFVFKGNTFLIVLFNYIFLGILILFTLIAYYVYRQMQKSPRKLGTQSTLLNWSLKLLYIYSSLQITVLPQNFLSIFLNFIQCNNTRYMAGFTCYQGMELVHLPFAVIGFCLFIFHTVVCHIYFNDSNPNSKFPLAQPETLSHFLKLGLKFLLQYYYILDPGANLVALYNIFFMAFVANNLNDRFMNPAWYNRFLFCLQVFVECFTLCTTCMNCLVYYLDPSADPIGFFYVCIGGPLFYGVFITAFDFYTFQITKKNLDQVTTDDDKQSFVLMMIILIRKRNDYNHAIVLEGMVKWHVKSCETANCFCKELLANELMNVDREFSEDEQAKIERAWYLYVEMILQYFIQRANHPFKLHLIWAYILFDKLNNPYRSIVELMYTVNTKPSFQEEYSAYRHQLIIQESFYEEYDKKCENQKELDFDKIVSYTDKIQYFQEEIDKSCVMHLNYWRELMEQIPEIQKIEKIGEKITEISLSIKQKFDELIDIYPQNLRTLTLYANYLKLILNDTDESEKILESVEEIKKQLSATQGVMDLQRVKYGQNSKVGLILCNNKHDIVGTIHKVNKEILHITKYKKQELIEQNVTKLMPKFFAEIHDQMIVDLMVSTQPKYMDQDRIVMLQNKQHQFIPCSIYLRLIQSMEEGFLIAGFINEIQYKKSNKSKSVKKQNSEQLSISLQSQDHYILYRPDIDTVEGISKSLMSKLGIPIECIQYKIQSNSHLSMERIVPEIYDPEGEENMKNGNGQLMEIDVIQILYYYMLDEEDEDAIDSDQQESEGEDSQGDYDGEDSSSGDSQEALSKITEEEKLVDNQSAKSKRQSRIKSFSEKNSLKSRINKMQKIRVRTHLVQESIYDGKKINMIKVTEEEDSEDGKSEYKRNDYKKLAKTLIGGKSLTTKVINDSEKDDLQTKDSNDRNQEQEKHLKSKSSLGSESNSQNMGSSQLQESVNEDHIKQFKEFKSKIQEKKIPQTIVLMDKFVLFLLVAIISLLIAEFAIKINYINYFSQGISSITDSYMRHNQMSDINYYQRKLWAIANNYWAIPVNFTQDSFFSLNQNTLFLHNELIQKTQFQIIKDQLQANSITSNTFQSNYITTSSMLQNGQVVQSQQEFTDAIFSYTTGANTISNSTMANMIFPDGVPSNPTFVGTDQKYFYYNKVNGLYVLRNNSEYESEKMYNFYYNLINTFHQSEFIVFMTSIAVILIGTFGILPFLFTTHKSNNKVLSLFGLISPKKINELVLKVENFQNMFLDWKEDEKNELQKLQTQKASQTQSQQNQSNNAQDQEKHEDFEIQNETESDKPQNQTINNEDNFDNFKNNQEDQHQFSHRSNVNQNESQVIINIGRDKQLENQAAQKADVQKKDSKKAEEIKLISKKDNQEEVAPYTLRDAESYQQSVDKKKKSIKKLKEKKQEEQIQRSEKEILQEKSEKINQSTNSSSMNDLYKIIIFSIIFLAVFIALYETNENTISQLQDVFDHYYYIQQTNPMLKYVQAYTLEEICTGQPNLQNGIDLREYYSDLILEQQQQIFDSAGNNFPSQFNDYDNLFANLNFNNTCFPFLTTATDVNNNLTQAECQTVANQVLPYGLKLGIQSFILTTRNIIQQYRIAQPSLGQIINFINGTDFINADRLLQYLVGPNDGLRSTFQNDINSYLNSYQTICVALFISFVCFSFVIILIFWIPFKRNLTRKVWRVKGMLNMIPMDILVNDETVKQAIQNQKIFEVVN
ncbi:hypothetical protein ABPG74_002052 [Tetrahymena malaccensis]